jgi:hypothetical protein
MTDQNADQLLDQSIDKMVDLLVDQVSDQMVDQFIQKISKEWGKECRHVFGNPTFIKWCESHNSQEISKVIVNASAILLYKIQVGL